jgi:hypothetical protein
MDPDPGGPKTYGFDGSGSATLLVTTELIISLLLTFSFLVSVLV